MCWVDTWKGHIRKRKKVTNRTSWTRLNHLVSSNSASNEDESNGIEKWKAQERRSNFRVRSVRDASAGHAASNWNQVMKRIGNWKQNLALLLLFSTCAVSICAVSIYGDGLLDYFWNPASKNATREIEFVVPIEHPSLSREDSIAQAKLRLEGHLLRAKEQTEQLVQSNFPSIDPLFTKAHDGILPFTEVCLGGTSKWKMVLDAIPLRRGGEHEAFLKQEFESKVLSSRDLERAIEQTIRDFLLRVRDIESEMLVDMKADIEDLPGFESLHGIDPVAMATKFDEALANASEKVGGDLYANVNTQLVSLLAGEVLAQVAIRLGVSGGILGAGAASSWATFGVGLLASLVVDQLVTRLWDWWADPEIELALQLADHLGSLHQLICDGDEQTPGLRGLFRKIASEREAVRRTAVDDMLQDALN